MKGIKTGGRQKGTPNKITQSTRQVITDLVNDITQDLHTNLDQLSLEEKARLLPRLLDYSIPKYQPDLPPVDIQEMLDLLRGDISSIT